jgi:hypothetical protein
MKWIKYQRNENLNLYLLCEYTECNEEHNKTALINNDLYKYALCMINISNKTAIPSIEYSETTLRYFWEMQHTRLIIKLKNTFKG